MISTTMIWKSGRQIWIATKLLRNYVRDNGTLRLPYPLVTFYSNGNNPYSPIDWEKSK